MDADLRELAEILAKAPRENNLMVVFFIKYQVRRKYNGTG